ncbi:MAG: hypothetical protein IPI60_12095 [Saprospiraceae bacterium]|nr:hypothetical protein [Saprospiraceae bacterium]
MIQRRTFIQKASFGFLLFGNPGFISGISSKTDNFNTLAQDIITAGGFKPVSILEYDPQIDRILSKEAHSLIKMGYTPHTSGYMISADRKQILSLFSIASSHMMPIALVLKKAGKTWKPLHTIDAFEIQARSQAIKALTDLPNPSVNAENIISMPKMSKCSGAQQKGKPYFVCNTYFDGRTAKTSASITIDQQSIWKNEFRTDF